MLFIKLLLIGFLMATFLVSKAVTIDGDFTDWSGVAPISKGFLSANPQNSAGAVNPITAVWMQSDEKCLYLSVLCTGPIKSGAWSPTLVAIDTDTDPNTGFPTRQLGVDYLIQPSNAMDGKLNIHERQAGANTNAWSMWHSPLVLESSYAVGSGSDSNRAEMRIPWDSIGVTNPKEAILRFCVADGSALLNPTSGSWCPAIKQAYFSYGNDPKRMDNMKNLVSNGGFEQLQEAAARALPQNWIVATKGSSAAVDVSPDVYDGKHSLHLKASGSDMAGMNSDIILAAHGLIKLRYKLLKASVGADNLSINIIGLAEPDGAEMATYRYTPPNEHIGDGQWHEASFEYDFSSKGAKLCRIEARVNDRTERAGEGEWLIDSIELYPIITGVQLKLANIWVEKPYLRQGESTKLSVWLENTGDIDAKDVLLNIKAAEGMEVSKSDTQSASVAIGEYQQITWSLKAVKPGIVNASVTARTSATPESDALSMSYRILVLKKGRRYTRQELCTDEAGFWRVLEKPSSLQSSNAQKLSLVKHKTSAQIGRNTYGICTHLPRSKDYEQPYSASHLIDGDPNSCWSSQNNSSPYPGRAPWAIVELPKNLTISQVNLIPYWSNSDFPVGFTISTSTDGKVWTQRLVVKNTSVRESSEKRGDKLVQSFPLKGDVTAKFVKVTFDRLPLSGGNYAEVSQGYKARLSGIELIDSSKHNFALAKLGAKVTVSDVFTAWQNTAKTVNESFPAIMKIGLKWVRVGQWGDQTEWGAVERIKGQFQMDPGTDAGINELVKNRVSILYGLNYGNSLYNDSKKPWADVGPVYQEGHPFYLNNGPRTDEQRAAFVRYVDWVIRKYGDRITWWELWNEQNGWFPGHEPTLYGKLLTAVAKHIKSVNPDLKVMYGGTAAPAPKGVEISLREGAAPYVDAYAFHPYGIDKPEGGMGTMDYDRDINLSQTREQTGWNHLEDIIDGVKQPFAQYGNKNIEVWENEFGTNVTGREFAYNPNIGEYACAKYLMRFYIYSGWLKTPTAWWALYNMNHSQDWGIIEQDGYGFRPMSYALQNVCSVVSDVEPMPKLDYRYEGDAPDPKVVSYQCDNSKKQLVAVWAADVTNEKVNTYPSKLSFRLGRIPKSITITDLYWGITQKAVWTEADGQITVDKLLVHDYPLVISCE